MNKRQVVKNNMYSKMLIFFSNTDNSSIWAGFTVLADIIILFVSKKAILDKYIIQQQLKITGITKDKSNKLLKAELLAVQLSRKAKVWAKKTENITLQSLFDLPISKLTEMAATESIAKMNEIISALNKNAAALIAYKITALNRSDLAALITSSDNLLGTPGAAKANTKAGTAGIAKLMNELNGILNDIDDLMIAEYEETENDMLKTYINSRKTNKAGNFATSIIATIVEEGSEDAIEKIGMHIKELNKFSTSNIEGIAMMERFVAGTYHIIFSGEGYITQTIILKINRGKKSRIIIEMIKDAVE